MSYSIPCSLGEGGGTCWPPISRHVAGFDVRLVLGGTRAAVCRQSAQLSIIPPPPPPLPRAKSHLPTYQCAGAVPRSAFHATAGVTLQSRTAWRKLRSTDGAVALPSLPFPDTNHDSYWRAQSRRCVVKGLA